MRTNDFSFNEEFQLERDVGFLSSFRRNVGEFTEMQLVNAARIGLRDCDAVVVDLDLFALFREMA